MKFWLLPAQGGPLRRLGRLTGLDAVYSHSGRWIAFTHQNGIWRTRADGSHVRCLTRLAGFPDGLAWSLHDRRLRFTLHDPWHQTSAIWQMGAQGRRPHPLLPGWSRFPSECCGQWTPDGRYFLFASAHQSGVPNLWALRAARWSWQRAPRGPASESDSASGKAESGLPGSISYG